jgi:hypothetical protein
MCKCLQSDSTHQEFWAPELRRPSQAGGAAGGPFPLRGLELPARSALATPATVNGRLIASVYPPPRGRLLTCAQSKGVLL